MQEQIAKSVVVLSLDSNGWMELLKTETIAAVNAFLDTLERDADDLVELTLLEHNDAAIETFCSGAKLSDVRRLTPEIYQPRGGPALVDGFFAAIQAAEDAIVRRRDNQRVVVIVHTGSDAAYKRRLLADPEAVLAEAGVPLPAGKRIRAVEETEGVEYFILPPAPSGELSDAQLDAVAAGRMGSTVPRSWCESCETACG